MNTNPEQTSVTNPRRRLLEAAGEAFAERGFRGTTVREICERAGTNIATVNYYFGGKEKLYRSVLQYSLNATMTKYPPELGLTERATARERLQAFVLSLILRLLDEGRPSWHGRLMAREMAEPTSALNGLVDDVIRPLWGQLESIVGELLGRRAEPKEIRLCAQSIIGQCVHYGRAKAVIVRLYPEQRFDSDGLKGLADHIMKFSLGALRQFNREYQRRGRALSRK
ncbi:MAG: CerR family C-terminal domain-containing protein [Nitrospirae bacterium]|nr:CerR family C-terminal domain-containing protein [Nitrospirota bacterium]